MELNKSTRPQSCTPKDRQECPRNQRTKAHRSKDHLRVVAQQPCHICGRTTSHAHHVRFAQSKGLGVKVSDEFTVPLCSIHHQQNHATGNERGWWAEHKIDPLPVARRFWQESNSPALAR